MKTQNHFSLNEWAKIHVNGEEVSLKFYFFKESSLHQFKCQLSEFCLNYKLEKSTSPTSPAPFKVTAYNVPETAWEILAEAALLANWEG